MKFRVCFIISCILIINNVFTTDISLAKRDFTTEESVISYVLSSKCLDVIPDNDTSSVVTMDQIINILIRFINADDEYKSALMYGLGEDGRSVYNVYEYADYHSTNEKEELVRTLMAIGVLPNEFMIYPNRMCTWEQAIEFITAVFDRNNLSKGYGGSIEYAKFRKILSEDILSDKIITYNDVKKVLFYSLFPEVMQRDRSKHGDFYYESVSDCLYLCHDYLYKIGYALESDEGIIIEGNIYYGDYDIEPDEYVLCLYKTEGEKKIIEHCLNIPEVMYRRILSINSVFGNQSRSTTEVNDLLEEVDVNFFKQVIQPFDKKEFLKRKGINLWYDLDQATITRAQVVRTAFGLLDDDFITHPVYSHSLPFVDVQSNHLYYNFISAAYNASIIEGYGDGFFYPDKACTWGEAIKILCCAAGCGDYAKKLANDNSGSAFPKYYEKVLGEFGMFEFDISYEETEFKDLFIELVWDFWCISGE